MPPYKSIELEEDGHLKQDECFLQEGHLLIKGHFPDSTSYPSELLDMYCIDFLKNSHSSGRLRLVVMGKVNTDTRPERKWFYSQVLKER